MLAPYKKSTQGILSSDNRTETLLFEFLNENPVVVKQVISYEQLKRELSGS